MTAAALASDGEEVFPGNPIGRRAAKGGYTRMTDRFELPAHPRRPRFIGVAW
jgi:hypothetical protein